MPSTAQVQEALLIRCVENSFLDLFAQGKLNGTVHTSVGQEFSAIAFAGQLRETDFIFSNHRCHGHYLAFSKDYAGLVAELLGKKSGTCSGIGNSQHLQRGNFFSNGIQGGIVPVAAGMALAHKLSETDSIGIVFIGDGTLGEGVVYETLNLLSLWQIPLLVVCENNRYAQSTRVENNLAGNIRQRAEAFGIQTFESSTEDVDALLASARASIEHVRNIGSPAFHLVNTYRLNPHSKGDDNRDPAEVAAYRQRDYLCRLADDTPLIYQKLHDEAQHQTALLIDALLDAEVLTSSDYLDPTKGDDGKLQWHPLEDLKERQVNLINRFFNRWLAEDSKNLFLGEDVLSPYGGAFKVARDLSRDFPNQVLSTPISEAAITGIANGLALAGYRPAVEIMFGDFITLALDQIINHASKFFHMYNKKVTCPLVVRTPMGGYRGYGPTHSQTLDRLLIGIDNVTTVAINTLVNPELIYEGVFQEKHPVIVIENKADYGKLVGRPKLPNYRATVSRQQFPVVRLQPVSSMPTLTIVTYGGMTNIVLDCIPELFRDFDLKCEVLVLSCINPIDYRCIRDSLIQTRRLVVVEEGSRIGGIASEIVSTVIEQLTIPIETLKVGALPLPIPSVRSLEEVVLPSRRAIVQAIAQRFT